MSEQNSIYRQSNLDKMASPDKLDDYIKVSNPAVWIILVAIAVLLAGALIWGFSYELSPDGLRPIDFLLGGG